MQSGDIAGSKKLVKTRLQNSIGSRSLERSSTSGRLELEGLLLFVYSNLFTSRLISTWRVAEKFFVEFFGFLFDNTSWGYLVFASLFPFYLNFISIVTYLLMAQSVNPVIALHLLLFRTQISQSKSNLAVILKLESKQARVFHTNLSFQCIIRES